MSSRRDAVCALFALMFIATGIISVPQVVAIQADGRSDVSTPAADYDFGSRESPISILLYTEYADMTESSTGEYSNTNMSLRATYGQRYVKDNLDDYTQLGSMISDYDVLIVVEQEFANSSQIDEVASAWSSFVPEWVSQGGIIICMGYWEDTLGVTHGLLNRTGLIELYNPVNLAYQDVNVTLANHALAFGVATTFTGPDGTVGFTASNGDVVCQSSGAAVVVDRVLGQGHAVMLGFDFYDRSADADMILANAIRLTKHVVFDASNGALYSPLSGFVEFATTLTSYGFAVSTMDTFDEDLIGICDILLTPSGDLDAYSSAEINVLDAFVAGGGGLMVTTDWGSWGQNTDPILQRFGFVRNPNSDYVSDSDDYQGSNAQVHYDLANMANHSATFHTNQIQFFVSTAFNATPAEAVPLVWTDSDGTESWAFSSDSAAGLVLAASLLYGAGRIMALADGDFLCDQDFDSDGAVDFYDQDNEVFAVNMMCWLLAAGLPEKTLLVDNSHGVYIPITYSDWTEFGMFITMNGFNLMWMNHFSDGLVDMADALLLLGGSLDFGPAEIATIVDFVSRGGGLFVVGDQIMYSEKVSAVTSQFGVVYNSVNGSIYEDDDYDTYNQYVICNRSNFADHPIMNGVDRMEFDLVGGFDSTGSGVALCRTDDDGTAHWYYGSIGGLAANVPLAVETTYNLGRVVAIADYNLASDTDPDGDSFITLYDSDNAVFLANGFYWLIENRAPIVEVISPNGGEILNGTLSVIWTAVDANRDELTFEVFYSDNGGADWTSLAAGISGHSYSWDTTVQADGEEYLIRVVAFDGYVQSSDDSDGVFELDNYYGFGLDPLVVGIIAAGVVVAVIIVVILLKRRPSPE